VRGERYRVIEGSKTPEITVESARKLLRSIGTEGLIDIRDRAIVGVLVYTACRSRAVARLRCGSFSFAVDQWFPDFHEKGGKSRQIPVRDDLREMIWAYIKAAHLEYLPKSAPLFRTFYRRTGQLNHKAVSVVAFGGCLSGGFAQSVCR
jgi:integrase/recombinase XerD